MLNTFLCNSVSHLQHVTGIATITIEVKHLRIRLPAGILPHCPYNTTPKEVVCIMTGLRIWRSARLAAFARQSQRSGHRRSLCICTTLGIDK